MQKDARTRTRTLLAGQIVKKIREEKTTKTREPRKKALNDRQLIFT